MPSRLHGRGRHRHLTVAIGTDFLGSLEACGRTGSDSEGVRAYAFEPGTGRRERRREAPSLRRIGKSGRLRQVFVPALFGGEGTADVNIPARRRLVQALVREITRGHAGRPSLSPAGVTPAFTAARDVPCPALAGDGEWVGFNGNGRGRRGRGYRIDTPAGWAARAGCPPGAAAGFVSELTALAGPLGLVAVGVGPGDRVYGPAELAGLAGSPAGRPVLDRLHVRVYTRPDFPARWASAFGWQLDRGVGRTFMLDETRAAIAAAGLSVRKAAGLADVDPSFLAKILGGRKPPPGGLLDRVRSAVGAGDHGEGGPGPGSSRRAG